MSEAHKTSARMSIWRIVGAATGAAIVLFGALWIALPFLIFEGPGMTKWPTPAGWFLTPAPYIGLVVVGFGLLLVRWSR